MNIFLMRLSEDNNRNIPKAILNKYNGNPLERLLLNRFIFDAVYEMDSLRDALQFWI